MVVAIGYEYCRRLVRGRSPCRLLPTYTFDVALTDLVAVQMLPLSLVDSFHFVSFCQALNPLYKPPSRRKLTNVLIPFQANRANEFALKKMRDSPSQTLTVEMDGWSTVDQKGLIGITLTNRNGNSMLLDLIDVSDERLTAEFIARTTIESLRSSKIDPQCFNVVLSDEAAAYKLARTIVCQNVNLRHMINYRCMAHVFNLVGFELSRQPGPFPILQKLSRYQQF